MSEIALTILGLKLFKNKKLLRLNLFPFYIYNKMGIKAIMEMLSGLGLILQSILSPSEIIKFAILIIRVDQVERILPLPSTYSITKNKMYKE